MRLLRETGELTDAEVAAESWVELAETESGPESAAAAARHELGRCVEAQGRFAEAESLLVAANGTIQNAADADRATREAALEALVEPYEDWNRPAAAQPYRAARLELTD